MVSGHVIDLIYKVDTLAKYLRGKLELHFYVLIYIHASIQSNAKHCSDGGERLQLVELR